MGREEGGKHIQEWVLKLNLKAPNWCPIEMTDTPFPSGRGFPFLGMKAFPRDEQEREQ